MADALLNGTGWYRAHCEDISRTGITKSSRAGWDKGKKYRGGGIRTVPLSRKFL